MVQVAEPATMCHIYGGMTTPISIYLGVGDLNSGPHAYTASNLPSQPPLQHPHFKCAYVRLWVLYLSRGTCSCALRTPVPQVPVLVWFFAAVRNTMAKSILWRKAYCDGLHAVTVHHWGNQEQQRKAVYWLALPDLLSLFLSLLGGMVLPISGLPAHIHH